MELKKRIAAIAESEDERMLLVRVCDRLERAAARETPAATAFCEVKGPVRAGEERDIDVCVEKHNLAPGDYKISLEMVENVP